MSKSLGNVIDPHEIIDKYGSDTFRCYLMSQPIDSDISFSLGDLTRFHNNLFADMLGNLANRVTVLAKRMTDGRVPDVEATALFDGEAIAEEMQECFADFKVYKVIEKSLELLGVVNKNLTDEAPWLLGDSEEEQRRKEQIIRTTLEGLHFISQVMCPIIPRTSAILTKVVGKDTSKALDPLSELGATAWNVLEPLSCVSAMPKLFQKFKVEKGRV
eukprot:TRINITY_DN12478_c0_g2_i1.p1 TRINITY_DN12478_c0_g2~~TRINITY_DN12478_c0_g2_i1.p1  ORF type:complete len:235 (+),score=40.05 TRINITY_DN12478_c0_g2_i1:60-707(+)